MNKVLFVNVDFLDKKRKVKNGQMSVSVISPDI